MAIGESQILNEAREKNGAGVDSRIRYPSYKSFDEFVDLKRLRSLDKDIGRRIEKRLADETDFRFYTGPYKLDDTDPDLPGSRMIYLAQSTLPDCYFDLDKAELWQPTEAAAEFALLMDFIATLPFAETGRILLLYDDQPRAIPAHRDHLETDVCHEFVWFRTNLRKPFYALNGETGEKLYLNSYTAWFDTVNQFHGGDACDGLSFSVRVDGKFTDEFKKYIPQPAINRASTPALWAALADADLSYENLR